MGKLPFSAGVSVSRSCKKHTSIVQVYFQGDVKGRWYSAEESVTPAQAPLHHTGCPLQVCSIKHEVAKVQYRSDKAVEAQIRILSIGTPPDSGTHPHPACVPERSLVFSEDPCETRNCPAGAKP